MALSTFQALIRHILMLVVCGEAFLATQVNAVNTHNVAQASEEAVYPYITLFST